jgi:hypothetical protein
LKLEERGGGEGGGDLTDGLWGEHGDLGDLERRRLVDLDSAWKRDGFVGEMTRKEGR